VAWLVSSRDREVGGFADDTAGPVVTQRERLELCANKTAAVVFRDDQPDIGSNTVFVFRYQERLQPSVEVSVARPGVPTGVAVPVAYTDEVGAEVGELFLLRVVLGRREIRLRCASCSLTGRAREPNLDLLVPATANRAYNQPPLSTPPARVVDKNSSSIVRRADDPSATVSRGRPFRNDGRP